MDTQNNIVCSFCVMDTSVPDIVFDENNQCQFCKNQIERIAFEKQNYPNYLEKLVHRINKNSKKEKYDCIIGVSGGVDSTYVAFYVKKVLNLNPLAIHLDNGWNSELSVYNIQNCLDILEIDLITHVIDWNEFKSIQKALLKSSIKNLEIVSDHAINALLIKTAAKYKIKYIINGSNTSTEGIMPSSWMESNTNKQLIKSIYKKFYPNNKIKSLPTLSLLEFFYYFFIKRIKFIPILNFIDYNKKDVLEILKKEVNYKPYKYKHYESIITRFFQGYILPNKFNIDKRKAHFSSLIVSGQMTRHEALENLKTHPYGDVQLLERDKTFFLKKLNLNDKDFEQIMNTEAQSASQYSYFSIKIFDFIYKFRGLIRKFTR